MKRAAAFLACFCLTATAFAQVDLPAQQETLKLLNKERAAERLSPLQLDARLSETAQRHAELMAKNHVISHQFYQEPAAAARMVSTGVHFDLVGENVASSQSASTAHEALMQSTPHRANILNGRFTQIGIGTARDEEGQLYLTEDFAHEVTEYSETEAEARLNWFVINMRRAAHKRQFKVVEHPELRQLACEMAKEDLLSMAKVRSLPGVSTTVVFTTADLSAMPKPLARFKDAPGKSLGVGVCYAPSASEVLPTYWAVVVTYF